VGLNPGVECGLRLFQQRDSTQPGLLGGAQRQFTRLLIKRGRDGQKYRLLAERKLRIFLRHPVVPHAAKVFQVARRRIYGRELRNFVRRLPGQDRGGPIDSGV
jgi:hypothetical protein